MTPRDRAQALRMVADFVVAGNQTTRRGWINELRALANELDPPPVDRWRLVRIAAVSAGPEPELFWTAALAEANKGMVSEAKLRAWVSVRPHLACATIITAIENGELKP